MAIDTNHIVHSLWRKGRANCTMKFQRSFATARNDTGTMAVVIETTQFTDGCSSTLPFLVATPSTLVCRNATPQPSNSLWRSRELLV